MVNQAASHVESADDPRHCGADGDTWPCVYERMRRDRDAAAARADDYSARVICAERERDAAIHDRQVAERRLGEWISNYWKDRPEPVTLSTDLEARSLAESRVALIFALLQAFMMGGLLAAAALILVACVLIISGQVRIGGGL